MEISRRQAFVASPENARAIGEADNGRKWTIKNFGGDAGAPRLMEMGITASL
jgi:hypothetical protein